MHQHHATPSLPSAASGTTGVLLQDAGAATLPVNVGMRTGATTLGEWLIVVFVDY